MQRFLEDELPTTTAFARIPGPDTELTQAPPARYSWTGSQETPPVHYIFNSCKRKVLVWPLSRASYANVTPTLEIETTVFTFPEQTSNHLAMGQATRFQNKPQNFQGHS